MGNELADGLGLLATIAIETVEHLDECPLSPLVIARIAGAHFPIPVKTEAYLV